ncbi:MAG: hypothetical protein ACRESI_06530 [Gammaproteobacteria bacterium]
MPATNERDDAEGMPKDKKEGEQLDKVLAHLDSIHGRLDAMSKRMDAVERKDASEKEEERDDAHRKDAKKDEDEDEDEKSERKYAKKDEDEEGEEREDADEDEDKAKKDAEEEDKDRKDAKKDESEDKKEKRRDARADSIDALSKQLTELSRRIPAEMTDESRSQFVESQIKADKVAQAFGDSAPRWQNGESLLQYRNRLVRKFQAHSPKWKDADLSMNHDVKTLSNIEDMVFADAIGAARNPAATDAPFLTPVTETDATGRRITRFFGNPEACWGQFKMPARGMININTQGNK